MLQFFVGPFLIWLPRVATAVLFILAVYLYLNRHRHEIKKYRFLNFKTLVLLVLGFTILYPIILTIAQYIFWNQSEFTRTFLNSPLSEDVPNTFFTDYFPALFQSKLGYFFFYSLGRFWIGPMIAIAISYGFAGFLAVLRKHRDRFFDTGEIQLGLALSMLVGWPNFAVFLPMVFLFIVLTGIVRAILFKETYTTLGWPFIFAAAVALMFGSNLIDIFNLAVLRI